MITKIDELPLSELKPLIKESEIEGFRFLQRLMTDWNDGTNRFEGEHEALYSFRIDGDLVGIAGTNKDPFSSNSRLGRLRRFYIKKSERRKGLGRDLVAHILRKARYGFDNVVLKTDSESASSFYEVLGFTRIRSSDTYTHIIDLENKSCHTTPAIAPR